MRDKKNATEIADAGWKVVTIWECKIEKDLESAIKPVVSFLE